MQSSGRRSPYFISCLSAFILAVCMICCAEVKNNEHKGRLFYLHENGADANKGTKGSPWQTMVKLNELDFQPGDTILLQGGATFEGTLQLDSNDSGNELHPVVITSYGESKASVHGGNHVAILLDQSAYVTIQNLHFVGSGRKEGNTENGIEVKNSSYIKIDSVEVEGFQKSGLLVFTSSHVEVSRVHTHDNGAAGISISGIEQQRRL